MKSLPLLALAAVLLLNRQSIFGQGSLIPPGAPAAIMKTLQQIEPRTDISTLSGDANYDYIINQPGSYYLTGNVGVTKPNGINVTAADVTIDLNGFRIARTLSSGGRGIFISENAVRCTVKSGSISGFSEGVYSDAIAGSLRQISVSGCSGAAISGHENWKVEDCSAQDNGSGILLYAGSTANNCTARGNTFKNFLLSGTTANNCAAYGNDVSANGFEASGSTLINCNAIRCTAYGFTGGGNVLANCSADDNGGAGFIMDGGTSMTNCAASDNSGTWAIRVGPGSTLMNCTATANLTTYGIYADAGSTLSGCVVTDQTGTAGIYGVGQATLTNCSSKSNAVTQGIFAGDGSQVVGCVANLNDGDGIVVSLGCTVRGCTTRANKTDGVEATAGCVISENNCDTNGNNGDGAGIHVLFGACRLEGNNVLSNDRGLDVDGAGNIIMRNSAKGNTTNYDIVAGNAFGPIVNVAGAGDISGIAAASHPWANFAY